MSKIFKIFIITAILSIISFANDLPQWFEKRSTDIDTLFKKANKEHKFVMLFFDEEGCPWCEKMVDEIFKNPQFSKLLKKRFMIIHIDNFGKRDVKFRGIVKKEDKFRKDLKIFFSPTMLFLDSKEDIIATFPGYRNSKKFRSIIDYILSKAYKKYSYEEYLNEREFR